MNEDMCLWYECLGYEEGFGPGEVPSSLRKKKQIDTYVIINAYGHAKRHELFSDDGELGCIFYQV